MSKNRHTFVRDFVGLFSWMKHVFNKTVADFSRSAAEETLLPNVGRRKWLCKCINKVIREGLGDGGGNQNLYLCVAGCQALKQIG